MASKRNYNTDFRILSIFNTRSNFPNQRFLFQEKSRISCRRKKKVVLFYFTHGIEFHFLTKSKEQRSDEIKEQREE